MCKYCVIAPITLPGKHQRLQFTRTPHTVNIQTSRTVLQLRRGDLCGEVWGRVSVYDVLDQLP